MSWFHNFISNWALTENNLGVALQKLGERESGTQHLEQAVQASRAALIVFTNQREPLDWAMAQNNLGSALATLGKRESGTRHLQDAVEAFRAASTIFTRGRVPLQWAITQNNLGAALQTLGERSREHNICRKRLRHCGGHWRNSQRRGCLLVGHLRRTTWVSRFRLLVNESQGRSICWKRSRLSRGH